MTFQKFALLAALAMPLVSSAETPPSPPAPTKITVSDNGLAVLARLHHNDMLEVKAGKLALEKGASAGVKSFGKTLVDEHSADARMILSLVKKQGLALPDLKPIDEAEKAEMTVAQETFARLGQMQGKQFDIEFLRAQIAMHDKTLAKLDLQIAQLKGDSDLVAMLQNIRPVIAKHKEHAQTLLGSEGGNEHQRR